MDKKILTIIILSLVVIGITGVFAYNEVEKNSYNKGFNDATLIINEQIIRNLIENGYINIYIPINETTTQRVILVPLE